MAVLRLRAAHEGRKAELHLTSAEAARIAAGDTTFVRGEDLDEDSDVVEVRVYVSESPAPATSLDGT